MTVALEQTEAALLQSLAAIRAALEAIRAARSEAAPPNDILSMSEAVEISGRPPCTIRRWARQHRLGRRLGGVWILSRQRFTAFVEADR